MAAVRHWLRGGKADESERIGDLMRFGVSEEEARRFVEEQGEPGPVSYPVWPRNADALNVFLRLRRQWRLHPYSGRPLGLDHAAIPATLTLMGIPRKRWPALFDQLGACEGVVMEVAG